MKIKNCPHVNYKYYRRFKPLIRKDMNLIVIHNYVFAFTMLCCAVGFFCGFCGDIGLPKFFFNCLNVATILSILGLFYTIYLELKLKKQIKKIIEEIKEEQKSQFK